MADGSHNGAPRDRLRSAAASAKLAAAFLAPNGYYVVRDELRERRRRGKLGRGRAALAESRQAAFSVEEAVSFLVARGVDEQAIRDGSMPQASLDYAAEVVRTHVPAGGPIRALQVGNFVGVSLAYLSALLRSMHADSVVVSVDPNITHRGIRDPQRHVLALLGHFGLLRNNVVITGYSLEQNFGDDSPLSPAEHVASELACERVLDGLATLLGRRIDVVLLDGNHTADYLAREMQALRGLLRGGCVLIVDDVTPSAWRGVVAAFDRATAGGDEFEELGRDGRLGVLRLAGG